MLSKPSSWNNGGRKSIKGVSPGMSSLIPGRERTGGKIIARHYQDILGFFLGIFISSM